MVESLLNSFALPLTPEIFGITAKGLEVCMMQESRNVSNVKKLLYDINNES